ncbi:BspA family leucine-rich repeat surface protein [Treponema ruminis]|uniref:Putative repeat protein (TIGR02543 family) n=1 Tax=Treponema ruminis TaxID=744515 RepID=A0A7W8LMG5_9SPIR|nr:BspA family leucine-rich repeat surface protein [Treponema ruminis]MBB5226489.1 putative repeat protein (TIGR02543 family) [Treponema ruminis]QSI02606.1 BspA family leucine-rich repeat surface protein [Treponema ruminis]
MKRKILSALAAITALALASCSMFNSGSEEDSSQPAYIKVGVKDISRSALPNVTKEDEFEQFTLTGTAEDENVLAVKETWATDETLTAWTKMKEASIPVTEGAGYSFTLSAVKGGATWQGSCAKTIQSGKNTLTFTLSLSALSAEGKGNLEITLSLPVSVKAVEAKLTNKEDPKVTGKTEFKGGEESGSVSFAAKDIPSGNYLLTFSLFGDEAKTLKLGEWREYAGITKGLTSSSTDKISELEEIYTIDLELGEGTLQGTIPGSYTRYSDKISLPDAKKAGDTFDGWVDGNGEEITEIKKGTVGNITLKAKWLGGIYVTAEQVKNGELKTKLLEAKGANLKNVKVVLPEGITSIESSLFEGCTFLSEFTIPAGVTEIESSVFKGCSALSEIKIPAKVTKIGASAFKDCTSLESFEYDGTAKEWAEVERGSDWHQNVPATKIECTDGSVDLDYDGKERISPIELALGKVELSGDIKLTFDKETGIFTAEEGFDSYQWYLGGSEYTKGNELTGGKPNQFKISKKLDIGRMNFYITVIAKDADGKVYAAEHDLLEDIKVVKVTFVENADGTGDLTAKTKTTYLYTFDDFRLDEGIFIRKGYELVCWNTKADGSGTSYKVDDKIPATEDITLYAQWKGIVKVSISSIDAVLSELDVSASKNVEYFTKSPQPPAGEIKLAYFDDEKNCPLWYDEKSRTLFYYLPKWLVLEMPEMSDAFFANLFNIKEIELSDFDTSNVTSMVGMFAGCNSLTSLDLSSFDTSNVTDMSDMFSCCSALEILDLSKFDTSKVTGMSFMFSGCSALESLDLSSFDTSKVSDMNCMFSFCSALESLDLSSFKTPNVTNMTEMFAVCSALTSLDLSSFDTKKVTDMVGMFNSCSALTSLDLSKFDTSNVTDMPFMFAGCGALTTIYVKEETDWSSSINLLDSTEMFKNCEKLAGGSGTAYSEKNPQDVTYARVDGGTDAPGYFTVKKPAVE